MSSALPLTLPWHSAPRRWGHPFHAICSYMAMFPPSIPHFFIQWLTEKGDVVYDPFSGRGTTVLEACLSGRVGLGSDANPLACALTGAKVAPPSAPRLETRLCELEEKIRNRTIADVPDHIQMLFHRETLSQLVWLREKLSALRGDDRFIYAALLGILHANAKSDGTPRGLTVSMPNTFAMAPNYVRKYIKKHKLKASKIDVLDAVRTRIARLTWPNADFMRGIVWNQDVRKRIRWRKDLRRAKLIFTSPPYLQVMKYGKMNWIRLWLLGHEHTDVDADLFASASLEKYLSFMSAAIKNLEKRLRSDGYICLVIGDVRRGDAELNLAAQVASSCLQGTRLRVLDTIDDSLPVEHKVSRIWGSKKGRATKTDRILILGGPGVKFLPPRPIINWATNSKGVLDDRPNRKT